MALSRRNLIKGVVSSLAVAGSPITVTAAPRIGLDRLWIKRADTGEVLNSPFVFKEPSAARAAWLLYSHFWRDQRDGGQMVWIDRSLLLVLSEIQSIATIATGQPQLMVLNSGYRTYERNRTIEGAALNSMHVAGKAGDIRFENMRPADVAAIAHQTAGVGGVGTYSRFTHVDTGPVGRRWKGK